jgi:RNA polymerase sigma-70 factor (ECF subfamily)
VLAPFAFCLSTAAAGAKHKQAPSNDLVRPRKLARYGFSCADSGNKPDRRIDYHRTEIMNGRGTGSMTNWPALVREQGPIVWRIAYRMLGNDADEADCVQDVFAAALALSRRERVTSWPGLLRRLVTHHGLDRLRRRYRERTRTEALLESADVPALTAGPLANAEAAELASRLRLALAQLPQQEAEVFYLRCLEDMTYQEIATQLQLDVNTVGVALHRARARLRELLAGFLTKHT